MNVTIGLRNVARELTLDLDMSEDDLFMEVNIALGAGTLLRLTDSRGEKTFIAPQAIGYIQIAAPQQRRVGFSLT
ncbi:DUF3107 domain-containing protein [Schaalia suimastitidis]|uniref:DUF3107 domain-containing protein n=1 Tax=Schaalia suimastitidis TaxID=121163 RepID=UPI00041C456D|nr:DUF3107 domain-containing protein [Schaalia suimastitidis]